MVLLFIVLFFVYPLTFVFMLLFSQLTENGIGRGIGLHEAASLTRLYALGFTAVFVLFALMYAHAYKRRAPLKLNVFEILQTKLEIQPTSSWWRLAWCRLLWPSRIQPGQDGGSFVLGPALGIHGTIYGRRVRLLAASTGA
jgi:hypothetical protein